MIKFGSFYDTFDAFGAGWYRSDFALQATWNQTAWDETYVTTTTPGQVTLTFDGTDQDGKPFTGSEIQTDEFFGYGTYEVEMQASGVSGVVSSFFLFTSEFFGASQHNEIDIEFLGGDTTVMNINYFYGNDKLGSNGSVQVDLGFDAAAALHDYSIEWEPDAIRWYAEDTLLYEVTSGTSAIPIPDEAMKIYANVWTGGETLEHWHGAVDDNATAEVSYASVSYVPFTISDSSVAALEDDSISFAGQTEGVVVDMEAGTWSRAVKVMPIGDSLTVGAVNTQLDEVDALREGYRFDLFERILAGGGWVDFVGGSQNGPTEFLDRDHLGIGGKYLSAIVDDADGQSDLTDALIKHSPDITLFLAGTNDYYNNGDDYFLSTDLPAIVADTARAVAQFYAVEGNENRYLVISTLPPKAKAGVSPEYASFINQGYSMVGGVAVAGDAGNGTYVAGIAATVEALQANHPTLVLFDNPVTDIGDMSYDLIHISDYGYSMYAEAMMQTLVNEIGLTDGAFSDLLNALPEVTEVSGGEGGDRLSGSADADILRGGGGNDFIEGRGGADTLEGGTGTDVFAYGLDALDGTTDTILDYSVTDGDMISLGAILDSFGWSAAEIAANVAVNNGDGGADVSIVTPGGTYVVAHVDGVAATDVLLSLTQLTQVTSRDAELIGNNNGNLLYDLPYGRAVYGLGGNDTIYGLDGNDSIYGGTGQDNMVGGAGADTFYYQADDLDGSRDRILDFSVAGGDKLDLSAIATDYGWSADELLAALVLQETSGGDLRVSLDLPGGLNKFLFMDGVTAAELLSDGVLVLEGGPPPDTGDDDGNMTLTAPDTQIDATENSAVTVTLSGLDADATAIVTLSAGGIDLTQQAQTDGELVFDLTGLPDGPVTTSVTATDASGNSSSVVGPTLSLDVAPDTSADEDGNLAVSAPDTDITASEFGAVIFTVSGLDPDATAIVTVSDGAGGTVDNAGAPLGANGDVVLDLSSLADGMLSVSVTATDDTGNEASAAGPSVTLEKTGDGSADEDGNLAVSAPDANISAGEQGAVIFTVSGLDADATALVTVRDGAGNTVNNAAAPITQDGDVVLDLSGLVDGLLGVSVTATDTSGNVAQVAGQAITLDVAEDSDYPDPTIIGTVAADVLNGGGGDEVIAGLAGDDMIKGRSGNDWLLGGLGADTLIGGAGDDTLYGGAGADNLSGNTGADLFLIDAASLDGSVDDIKDFTAAEGDVIELRNILPQDLGADAIGSYLRIWKAGTVGLLQYDASGMATDWVDIASIRDGGDYSIADMTAAGQLVITSAGAPPDNGDDDGNMTLTAPDTQIDATENSAVTVTLSGLDVDATAIVTLSAGGTDLTQEALTDGELVFDLTGLPDGPVTTAVTATDSSGNSSSVVGPTLSLDTAPDTSADEDGNLAVVAPDVAVTSGEEGAVIFTVSGLDPDATAVVTVSDGAGGTVDNAAAPLGADGDVVLDLSSLSDGVLSVSVTATDDTGNMAMVDGAAISLDTSSTPIPAAALVGTEGSDALKDGNDGTLIYGLGGDDRLIGNGGDDTIHGGAGEDFLRGDNGDDVLDGGAGADILRGQDGADTFLYNLEALDGTTDRIDGFSGASGEGDMFDLSEIVSAFGWSEAEAQSHIAFTEYSGGVYLELVSAEVTQSLADVRDITLADITLGDFILV